MKADRAIQKEIGYVALGMLTMSALMNAVFLVIGAWSYHVLLSNLLTGAAMIGHFTLLCLAVQRAVAANDGNAQKYMKATQAARMLLLGAVLGVGVCFSDRGIGAPVFDFWALLPPLFFNRITLMIRGFQVRNAPKADASEAPQETEEND